MRRIILFLLGFLMISCMEKEYSILKNVNSHNYRLVRHISDREANILSDREYLYYYPYNSDYYLRFKSEKVLEKFLNGNFMIDDKRFIKYYIQREDIDPNIFENNLSFYLERLKLKLKMDELEYRYDKDKFQKIQDKIIDDKLKEDEEFLFLLNIYLKEIIRERIKGKWFFVKEYVLYPYYNPVVLDFENKRYDFFDDLNKLNELHTLDYTYQKTITLYEKDILIPPDFDSYVRKMKQSNKEN